MSKLSKKSGIKRKRRKRKKREKWVNLSEMLTVAVVDPEVQVKKGLKVTTYLLKGVKHKPIVIGGFVYQSAADFSKDKGWINNWGFALNITRDIYGNYMVCWKERFPLFDYFDYNLDDRHYRIILPCSSKEEAEQKIAFIQSQKELRQSTFEHNLYHLCGFYTKKEYKQLIPFVFYEDGSNAFVVEIQSS